MTLRTDVPAYKVIPQQRATWTTAYQNALPDSAFAFVRKGKKDAEGKTVPRTNRFLPYRDKDGNIDVPHLRNALSRLPQSSLSADEKAQAQKVLDKAAKEAGVGEDNQKEDRSVAAPDLTRAASPNAAQYLYVPITRIDGEKRMVEGVVSNEEVDTFGTIFDYDAMKRAIQHGWAGNVREQHDPTRAVGKGIEAIFDDEHRQISLRSYVSRSADGENTWTKINEGILTGYSVGVDKYKIPERRMVDGRQVPVIHAEAMAEISFVDSASNPGAARSGLTLYRAVGADGGDLPDILEEILDEALAVNEPVQEAQAEAFAEPEELEDETATMDEPPLDDETTAETNTIEERAAAPAQELRLDSGAVVTVTPARTPQSIQELPTALSGLVALPPDRPGPTTLPMQPPPARLQRAMAQLGADLQASSPASYMPPPAGSPPRLTQADVYGKLERATGVAPLDSAMSAPAKAADEDAMLSETGAHSHDHTHTSDYGEMHVHDHQHQHESGDTHSHPHMHLHNHADDHGSPDHSHPHSHPHTHDHMYRSVGGQQVFGFKVAAVDLTPATKAPHPAPAVEAQPTQERAVVVDVEEVEGCGCCDACTGPGCGCCDECQPDDTQMLERAASHPPFTGKHSHAHSAMGSQGEDDGHDHEHAHADDANHDHHAAEAGENETAARATTPTLAVTSTPEVTRAGQRISSDTRAGLHEAAYKVLQTCACPMCQDMLSLAEETDPDLDGDDDTTVEGDTDDDFAGARTRTVRLARVRDARLMRSTIERAVEVQMQPFRAQLAQLRTITARLAAVKEPDITRMARQLDDLRSATAKVAGLVTKMAQQPRPGPILRAADKQVGPTQVLDASLAPQGGLQHASVAELAQALQARGVQLPQELATLAAAELIHQQKLRPGR